MATVLRPAFYEGQVLAAADLTATVDQARGAAARHNRLQHDWGIVDGLELTQDKRTDPVTGTSYVAVTLQPGVAVDGTGREVVVAEAVTLAEAAFRQVNGADPVLPDPASRPRYPVFLAGHDQTPQTTSLVSSACGGAGASRVEESFQIVFGQLGSQQSWDIHPQPAPDSGPGDGTSPWNVLLGFVTWDGTHFAGAFPDADGIGRRFAGVRADTVTARSGRLTLRPDPAVTAGRAALVLDGANGLTVGRLTASGALDERPLLQLNTRGDLSVAGTFTPQGTPARVLVVSGTLTDGMLVPLPDGVAPDQIASGSVQLHVQVTPRLSPPATLPTGTWVPVLVECTVDSTDRRLRSTIRWHPLAGPTTQQVDLPAPADFLVIAAVAGTHVQAPGGTP